MGAKLGNLPFAAAVACISRLSSEIPRLFTSEGGRALEEENEAARSIPGKRSDRDFLASLFCLFGSRGGKGSSEDEAGNAEADGRPAVPKAAAVEASDADGAKTPGGRLYAARVPASDDVADEGLFGEIIPFAKLFC